MTTMTIRGIDDTLAQTLKNLAHSQGMSINALTLRLIREATGVDKKRRTTLHHDLDSLAGTWSSHEENEFRSATEQFELVDAALWQ